MAGRIDQVELVDWPSLAVYIMRTACALMVMPRSRSRSIESSTWSCISRAVTAGQLQQTVSQRGFAVIDVGNDRKIAEESGVHGYRSQCLILTGEDGVGLRTSGVSRRTWDLGLQTSRGFKLKCHKLENACGLPLNHYDRRFFHRSRGHAASPLSFR